MRIFLVQIIENDLIQMNKKSDKKLFNYLKSHFSNGNVLVIHRSRTRKYVEDLYSFKVVFINDEDANYFHLVADKNLINFRELRSEEYTLL